MDETVCTYLLDDPFTLIPMGRKEFYAEQIAEYKKTGKPSRAVEIVNVFIFNSQGDLIVQKRSYGKAHNPGLLDKSIGGHMQEGDTPDFTVMLETVQELQTPSIVLKNREDFLKTFKILRSYLDTIALVRHSRTKLYVCDKIIGNEQIKIANKSNIYFGIYDGRIRPADREAKGILYYSLPDLKQEMEKFPQIFTPELRIYVEDCSSDLEEFLSDTK